MIKPNISLKITDSSKKVKRVVTRKSRRIYQLLKANNFQNCVFDVCVTYQKGVTNRGTYTTKEDLIYALKAFLEVTF